MAIQGSRLQCLRQSGTDVLKSPLGVHMIVLYRTVVVLFIMSGVLALTQPRQARAGDLETRVKVAYIYNFTKFIDWPGNGGGADSDPVRICVIGNDPIRTTLGELASREVKGRPIKIVRIKDPSTLSTCHLLFISRSEESQVAFILQRLQGAHVLTVSDIPRFAQRGGMISFVTENDRIKIEINPLVVRQAGLKVSAKLFEIARIVQ